MVICAKIYINPNEKTDINHFSGGREDPSVDRSGQILFQPHAK